MEVFLIDKSIESRYSSFIKESMPTLTKNWVAQAVISDDDPFKSEIIINGTKLIDYTLLFIEGKINEDQVVDLAHKIALERAKASANIGDFVYNSNIGRSELFKHLSEFEESISLLQPLINKINYVFDQFIYFTVKQYSYIITQDIEEKKHFIDETHKERLTILGQMSASFVHEFRNPLTSIIGFVKLLKGDHPELKYLDIIDHELHQLNFRIDQFLHVSKKDHDQMVENFLINDLFKEITDFLYPSIVNSNVILQEGLFNHIYIPGFRNELRQVLLNILMNSIDALAENNGQKTIHYQVVDLEDKIEIQIRNNGPKISEESIRTIFEPFVTTKNHGTGIGLFVCKQIVEKHDGKIECISDEDWTAFCITLPKEA
ncbi:histidine kinase [Bacillus sp. AFS017336]|nr:MULTISPECIES: HAMP domain-containing sensor histidine kinase [unclassified Bacillus (in: firmicutes)]PEJ48492.1 histidine kinase [Bacillus sp. AFS002410]PEK99861.1 histidine kinase [Bacillus sp. AFS017336]QKE71977.1 HAMP domain-containing histidine kinase [Arthrobacter citreus]